MKKIVSIVLLYALLLMCFSGCSTSDSKEDTREELDAVFEVLKADSDAIEKMYFSITYEKEHYELKSSGRYVNSEWLNSCFIVTVSCDYDRAVNEKWYKRCKEKDNKSLNQAFYNSYKSYLSKGNYSNIIFNTGMHLIYYSVKDFNKNYATIKAFTDLEYVKRVSIRYQFALPRDYMAD